MLSRELSTQIEAHLRKVTRPVTLVTSLDDGPASTELVALLTEVAALSDLVTVERRDDDARRPSFRIERAGTPVAVGFAGAPTGHELTSFVLALLQVGGHPPAVPTELVERIQALEGEHTFETYLSLSCQSCPDVVQALNAMSVINPSVRHVAIDGARFRDEVEAKQVMAVPAVFLDGRPFVQGRTSLEEILARLDAAGGRTPGTVGEKEPFDVLVVGGGPAGATAAIYAARKGLRTGVVTERFGGQVLDTLAIENFVSVPYTEGPQLATALEQHVRGHDVDVVTSERAARLVPAATPGGLHSVELERGGVLHARTVVLSTGARWRAIGVPGEQEHRNRGVTYCPHCDGPLFAGKRVAVVGGGNSGVEAAIDLAGIAEHVTLLEYEQALRADEVLQRKLATLPNTRTITGARTTEVVGDGERVTAVAYEDRATGAAHRLPLDGVFVQIGLLPNTEWLADAIELSPHGEIVVDARGETSVPGVFAGGDCTTVPFKQIVIAMGTGSTAALSAFDHLIRTTPAPVASLVA